MSSIDNNPSTTPPAGSNPGAQAPGKDPVSKEAAPETVPVPAGDEPTTDKVGGKTNPAPQDPDGSAGDSDSPASGPGASRETPPTPPVTGDSSSSSSPADPDSPAEKPTAGPTPTDEFEEQQMKKFADRIAEAIEKRKAAPTISAKAAKAAIKMDQTFEYQDRKFICLVRRAHIPGVGTLTAEEICASLKAQGYLVDCLDSRGSGIIRETF